MKGREDIAGADAEKGDSREGDHNRKDAKWEKPVLEDVSGKVMAQPYIRFT